MLPYGNSFAEIMPCNPIFAPLRVVEGWFGDCDPVLWYHHV